MSAICKTPTSVAGTCKTASDVAGTCKNASSVAGTCKVATAVYGVNPILLVVEPSNYIAACDFEGAITPSGYTYTLRNVGDAPLDWTASVPEEWVDLSVVSGTLLPDEEIEVDVTLDNAALTGINTATISFINTTNDEGSATRDVVLTVTAVVVPACEQSFPDTVSCEANLLSGVVAFGLSFPNPFAYIRFHIVFEFSGVTDGVDTGTATFSAAVSLEEAFISETGNAEDEYAVEASFVITPTSGPSCEPIEPLVTVTYNGYDGELTNDATYQILVVGYITSGGGPGPGP